MSWFPEYTIESAPAGSRRFMVATQNHLGYLPAATARWAASPHLLEGFAKLNAIFENGTLDPVAREVVVMTIATRNGCHICVAMHSARLTALGASPDIIAALPRTRSRWCSGSAPTRCPRWPTGSPTRPWTTGSARSPGPLPPRDGVVGEEGSPAQWDIGPVVTRRGTGWRGGVEGRAGRERADNRALWLRAKPSARG
jgi:AhpD family alkylhydroperoxidase